MQRWRLATWAIEHWAIERSEAAESAESAAISPTTLCLGRSIP
jgi:hypothetical protein